MQLTIRTRSVDLTPALRAQIERRVGFAMARLGTAIRELEITLADVNGPRGGIDKQCRVQVHGDQLPPVVIEAAADALPTAIDRALGRAARAVVRARGRRRTFAPALPRAVAA
ncbi:MAG: HPF/RaiA family ribosome-associated protein [Kofleriaceae bacterium]